MAALCVQRAAKDKDAVLRADAAVMKTLKDTLFPLSDLVSTYPSLVLPGV